MKVSRNIFIKCFIFYVYFANNSYAFTRVKGSISQNTTWTANKSPYIVEDYITIEEGVTLTIEPGVVVKFYPDKGMTIYGTLEAVGSVVKPIYFTSFNDNSVGGETGTGKPRAGDWQLLSFQSRYGHSKLKHCVIRYGGKPSSGWFYFAGMISLGGAYFGNYMLTIENCQLSDSASFGVWTYGSYACPVIIRNCSFFRMPKFIRNKLEDQTIDAEGNWWEKAPPDKDKFEGLVDYEPWLTLEPLVVFSITSLRCQAKPEGKIHLFWDTVSGINVSYYNIYRSTFAVVNSYSEKISSTTYNYFIDTTTTEGTRYYYCITAVVDGVESNESNIVNEIADASSPNINILTGGILGLVGIGYRVKATITDTYHLVGGATLYYCIDGSTTWYNTYMFKSEDNTWVGEIPSKFITLSGVRFYIKAEDTAGNIAVLPELNPEINSFKIDVISSLKIYVFPNKAATILLPDETELYITTSAVSVDDVLQVRIPQNVPHVQEGLVSPPADVKEFYFVSGTQRLAKECSLILPYSLKDSINEHKLRIYLWDTNKWVYVDSTVNLYKKVVSGKINRLGLYAVIADTIPPVITNFTPTTGDILPKRPVVAANIYDTGSGIEINSIKFVVSYPAGTKTTQVVITTISYPSNEIIVSDNSVKFIPLTDYIPGYTYTIELYVGDKSGNIAKHTVNFKVGSEPLLCTYSYPNPFDPLLGVNIKYILNEQMKETKIKIYNVEGKVIKVLNGSSVAGVNIVFWDGRDDNGNIVNSEVFLCHIQVKDMNDKIFKKVIKMLAWR